MQISSISFSGSKFLKKQETIKCALCGEPVFPEKKLISKLHNTFQVQKGEDLAKTLEFYFRQFREERIPKPLLKIYKLSKDPKYKEYTFKNLTYHITDKRIDYKNPRNTIRKLFSDIVLSLDHITPKAKGGINNQANYLPMHAGCNHARKIYQYSSLSQKNPEFINNIRSTIETIKQAKEIKKIRVIPNYFDQLVDNLEHQGLPKEKFADLEF